MNQPLNIPSHSDLFEPTIKALKFLGGSGTVQEIYDKVCELQSFSEQQQSILHKQEATRDGAPVLDLIDGEQLCQILKDLNLGVETKMIEVVEIDQNWFNHL